MRAKTTQEDEDEGGGGERDVRNRVLFGFRNIISPVVQNDLERQQLFQKLCWGTKSDDTEQPPLLQVSRSCFA